MNKIKRWFFVRLYGDLWRMTCADGHQSQCWIGPGESAFLHSCKCGAAIVGAAASKDERLIPSLLKMVRRRSELKAYERLAPQLERMEADLDRIFSAALDGHPELMGLGYKKQLKGICLILAGDRQEPVTAGSGTPVELWEIQNA